MLLVLHVATRPASQKRQRSIQHRKLQEPSVVSAREKAASTYSNKLGGASNSSKEAISSNHSARLSDGAVASAKLSDGDDGCSAGALSPVLLAPGGATLHSLPSTPLSAARRGLR